MKDYFKELGETFLYCSVSVMPAFCGVHYFMAAESNDSLSRVPVVLGCLVVSKILANYFGDMRSIKEEYVRLGMWDEPELNSKILKKECFKSNNIEELVSSEELAFSEESIPEISYLKKVI